MNQIKILQVKLLKQRLPHFKHLVLTITLILIK